MAVPEVKQPHSWCPHALPGKGGCAIYRTRPEPCRSFHCMWLISEAFGPHWFPAKAHIVVDAKLDRDKPLVCFIVDPDYPRRWQEEPWFSDIKGMAKRGLEGVGGQKWTTMVLIKDQKIPIIGSARLLRAPR